MFLPEVRPHLMSGKTAAKIMKIAARKNVALSAAALASMLMMSQSELAEKWRTGIVVGASVTAAELVMEVLYPGLLEKLKK